jgi:hypothetical protein
VRAVDWWPGALDCRRLGFNGGKPFGLGRRGPRLRERDSDGSGALELATRLGVRAAKQAGGRALPGG